MPRAGKYVRAPLSATCVDVEDLSSDEAEAGRFVRAPQDPRSNAEEDQFAHYSSIVPDYQKRLEVRVHELENELSSLRRHSREEYADEVSFPTIPYIEPPKPSVPSTNGGVIRWDNIKPFPKNVAATKISVGGEDYYLKFVSNIDKYLKDMTDPAAEHEDFSKMCQEEGESAVKFHARLTEKVLLCGYSPADQDRFVRTQLLRGLRNQELKKAARTYGHDSNTIVQAATRAEAFQAEMTSKEELSALAISSSRFRGSEIQHKREPGVQQPVRHPTKRFNSGRTHPYQQRPSASRRYRCSRCFRPSHGGRECPAMRKNCNACGQRGHFAAACRAESVSMVKDGNGAIPKDENHGEQHINALSLQDVLVDCRIGQSSPIKFLIDSGADVNVIGGADWDRLEKQFESGMAFFTHNTTPHNTSIRAYAANKPMHVTCSFRATVEVIGFDKPVVAAEFLVVEEGRSSLLGRATASDMGLLKVGEMVNACEESSIFPRMPDVKIKFSVDCSVPPVRNAYYNIPAAYREEHVGD
ncbi:uncharacterized protein LOC134219715 [Armigeres subalbatus]|uniref:uncharacterized protein LOC134219715 n=1 Tax=Armigeres subalbatus TaxID=124917 RepID=UPI002ED11D00